MTMTAQQEDYRNGFIAGLMGISPDPRRDQSQAYAGGYADGKTALSTFAGIKIRNKLDQFTVEYLRSLK